MNTDKKEEKKQKKLLFLRLPSFGISPSFAANDYQILKQHYDIREIIWQGKRSILSVIFGVLWSDIVYSWFAADHSYLSAKVCKAFGKKIIVIAGGFDVAYEPEIGYGYSLDSRRKKYLKFTLSNANKIIAVSNKTKEEVLAVVPEAKTEIVYLGVAAAEYPDNPAKEKIVLNVGHVTTDTLVKKGILAYIKCARHLPDVQFNLVGKVKDDAMEMIKPHLVDNLHILGWQTNEALISLYSRSQVYVQLSIHESFGLSVLEGMLSSCVPVITEKGAMPEVVENTGYYVPVDDIKATVEAIGKALQDKEKGKLARARAISMFDPEIRKKRILDIVQEVIKE